LAGKVNRFLDELPLIVNREPSQTNGIGQWSLIDDMLTLGRYELRTSSLRYREYEQVGFTGEAEFEMLGGTRCQALRIVHLLARFSFYAGVGYKTTMGMGQSMPV
jgi:CRISPR-associated endoribonuclease Cas6